MASRSHNDKENMTDKKIYTWQVEMFKGGTWQTQIRTYMAKKEHTDFDLHDVPGLRRNAWEILHDGKPGDWVPEHDDIEVLHPEDRESAFWFN